MPNLVRPSHRFGTILAIGASVALAGCGGGSSSGGNTAGAGNLTTITPATALATAITGGGPIGSNPFPWNRYFVTAFNSTAVDAVRNWASFLNSTVTYRMQVAGSPVYGNSGRNVTSNALLEAHLDYAFSTGLTGAGVTLGMIDDSIDTSNPQLGNKVLTLDNAPATHPSSEFHGNAVASVMVGSGADGEMIGFAPNANLFHGYLNYSANLNWNALGQYMLDAASTGAIAVNNSWGIASETVANTNVSNTFSTGGQATYLADLRSFAATGVVVFAAQNDYAATSMSAIAGLPTAFPDLAPSWITVINAIPTMNGDGLSVASADRISAPCAETATYCMTANGQTVIADTTDPSGYSIGEGASFAAPQVTGALGLLAEAFPDLTPQQLRDRLLVTADNGFFTADGTTNVNGINHAYSDEFGMGFLDLRAALLPIGDVVVPLASGGRLPAGQAAIAGGSASGNAIAASLGRARVIYLDQMGGDFSAPASTLAAVSPGSTASLLQGARLQDAGLYADQVSYGTALSRQEARAALDHRDVFETASGALTFAGGTGPGVVMGATRIETLRGADGVNGVNLSHDLDIGRAALRLGVSAFSEKGAALGVTAPGATAAFGTTAAALNLQFAAPLAPGLALRAEGEFGAASPSAGGGMVSGVSAQGYNRFGIALDRANALRQGDVLTLFTRAPVAITRGQADLTLPVAFSANGATFASTAADLAPSAREVDLGFEYGRPLAGPLAMRMGLAAQINAGNVAGRQGVAGFLGISVSF
ncbi:MAG: S8 family serine peptidase [Limimaricola sp.]|uniref:S8 family peptidase n=1 Tax=Limimaricola sp. TaxID=2211665 RepID=UPI001DB9260A|nr:S8 family peptidase [Limimaricola sp.]MBI1418478.1 S8 family serine peptidase [Limimaricola sp.]